MQRVDDHYRSRLERTGRKSQEPMLVKISEYGRSAFVLVQEGSSIPLGVSIGTYEVCDHGVLGFWRTPDSARPPTIVYVLL